MQLHLRDPAYTDRLAAFLQSLGQAASVSAPDHVELRNRDEDVTREELRIYLRVWKALYPEAEVEIG
jgi:hypothetical protein